VLRGTRAVGMRGETYRLLSDPPTTNFAGATMCARNYPWPLQGA
jgi:hypothetical protein